MVDLRPGELVWAAPEIAIGREQDGRHPALVVAGNDYLSIVDTRTIVVPLTNVHRGWPNHVPVVGGSLGHASWAMTEQVRTISRDRVVARAGQVDPATLEAVRAWIRDFLDL